MLGALLSISVVEGTLPSQTEKKSFCVLTTGYE